MIAVAAGSVFPDKYHRDSSGIQRQNLSRLLEVLRQYLYSATRRQRYLSEAFPRTLLSFHLARNEALRARQCSVFPRPNRECLAREVNLLHYSLALSIFKRLLLSSKVGGEATGES